MAGSVPNTYAAIGSLQPAALGAMLDAEAVLAAGSLSKQDIETVKLTVSAATGCGYCVAAHSLLGKLAGLRPDAIRNIRESRPTGDAKRDALVSFVASLVTTSSSPQSRLPATPISSSSRSALLSLSSLSPTYSIASTTPISIFRR
jgi:AhpD family alkylhydroperoxidase